MSTAPGDNAEYSNGEDLLPLVARIREFFGDRCPPRSDELVWGVGDDSIVGSAFTVNRDEDDALDQAKAFQRDLFDAGFAWLVGPTEYGGSEFSREEAQLFYDIARDFQRPDTSCFYVGQQILSPALVHHGTTAQKERWLRPIWRGDVVGCQLFSEPNAGSDLPSLLTRARRTNDGWIVKGQKVWSSGAHLSDVGELLVRTDDDPALRHRGLSMFLLDMTLPGITVRPLRQMTGNAHFCEVFFDDVVLRDDDLLGEVGAGWSVALTSLSSERDGFSSIDDHLFLRPLPRYLQLIGMLGLGRVPRVRQGAAQSYIESRIVELLAARMMAHPTPVLEAAGSSLVKLASTSANFDLAQRAASALGPSVVADGGSWGHFCWSQMVLGVLAPRIAGGTDQIQRNIIAERGLGMPREPSGRSLAN